MKIKFELKGVQLTPWIAFESISERICPKISDPLIPSHNYP